VESSRIRLAAIKALRICLGILLTVVLLVAVDLIVRLVFHVRWLASLRLAILSSGIVTGCVFLFFFLAELLEDSAAARREHSQSLVFPAVMWLRGVYLSAIVMGFTIMVGMYREGDSWKQAIFLPLSFVLLGYFPWPRAVRITESDVRQRGPFLNLRRIPFPEIESIDAGGGEVVVYGKNGARIVHSAMHADTDRFIEQMEARTGKEVTFPGIN
jgi:hypothetical protein